MPAELQIVENLADIPAAQWDALAGDNPFLRHAFLHALQASGCATERTGWRAQFLTLRQRGELVGAMPLYVKTHSYGEFVFDWAWAEAYQRQGLDYYPKWLSAVPFTPATGPRLLAATPELRAELIGCALRLARESGASSLHCLFPDEAQALEMQAQGMMLRRAVQFHWRNPGYADFDAYLSGMSHDKRKRIKQERRKVKEAGISFERIEGSRISPERWAFFFRCTSHTFQQYRSPQPLNLDFFRRIGAAMPENILLVLASRHGEPVAAALNFFNRVALYGRSWGALESHPGLHFETCYYQAIEFCIEREIALFEGGAQGEHKLARGFLPTTTWSAHWLAHPEFARAVEDFLAREAKGLERYVDELNDSNPFKLPPGG
ncbi:MAG: GNAT family N-acetyltransferase [Sulfuricella sp.]|nr:GNAT family N-acetyltransferase [Sulfuricella sp.]